MGLLKSGENIKGADFKRVFGLFTCENLGADRSANSIVHFTDLEWFGLENNSVFKSLQFDLLSLWVNTELGKQEWNHADYR